MRSGYIDYCEKYHGVDTTVRMIETDSHLYVYVTQHPMQMRLYNAYLKKALNPYVQKKLICICNLETYVSLSEISKDLVKIISKK